MARGDITTGYLSGQTDGKNILITATTSGGAQTIHSVASGTTTLEFITIEACNSNASHASNGLWLLMGGTTVPNDVIHINVCVRFQVHRMILSVGNWSIKILFHFLF